MSFEIDGLGSTQPPASPRVATASGSGSFASVLRAAGGDAVTVELDSSFPATPPPEVAHAISRAAQAYERLSAIGQKLHFVSDAAGGGLIVQLQDLAGNHLSTISAGEALRIAGGESPN